MDKLTQKEEELMQVLWQLDKAFVKDVVAELHLLQMLCQVAIKPA